MKVKPIEITINSVAAVITALQEKELYLNDGESLFFRGESKDYSTTKLMPKALRPEYENQERSKYYDLITNFPNEFEPLTRLSRLAKMQHYGSPTRLLDLTSNPLIALYFACKNNKDDGGCFYIFKTNKIMNYDSDKVLLLSCLPHLSKKQQNSLQEVLVNFASNPLSQKRITPAYIEQHRKLGHDLDDNNGWFQFERLIGEAFKERASFMRYETVASHLLSNYIVNPLIQNERHKRQDGLFMIFGLPANSENLGKIEIVGIEIDRAIEQEHDDIQVFSYHVEIKTEIMRELELLGINDASIFCDIESRIKFLDKRG